MDILKTIKAERDRKKRKDSYSPRLFDVVGTIVRKYSLDSNFVEKLDYISEYVFDDNLANYQPRSKKYCEVFLFALLTEEEYRTTMAIIRKVNNPYLGFARSPEEIVLCKQLFERSPELESEKLARYHLETLLLYELAREELRGLTEQMERREGTSDENTN